jgi:quaternary ammonium compound-resistance protein SugE
MAWWILLLAGLFEIGWAIGLKYTDGLTRLWPTVATGMALAASMALLALAVRDIPLGTAYAVWTGIGAVGAVILGIVLFGESASAGRMACLALIVGGIVGLKVLTPPEIAAQAEPRGETSHSS